MKLKNCLLCSLFLVVMLTVLTGCNNKVDPKDMLDLKKISEGLNNLESNEFDRFGAVDIIKNKVEGLEDVYDYDFKKTFKITSANIEEYSVGRNKETKEVYFIVKPVEGKKNAVKKEIDAFLKKEKIGYTNAVIDSFLVYIATNQNNGDLLNEIQKCHTKVLGEMMDVEDDLLEQTFGIKKNQVEEYMIKTPMMMTESSTIVIIKANSKNKTQVKEAMDKYFTKLEEQWSQYLPDQYELVKNRLEKEYKGYYIYIATAYNDSIWNLIEKN